MHYHKILRHFVFHLSEVIFVGLTEQIATLRFYAAYFCLFRCVDYLQIRNAAHTEITENCGEDIGELNNYTVTESKTIHSRTSDYCQIAVVSSEVKFFFRLL